MTRIAIAGATGRMGRALIETVLKDSSTALTGAVDRADSDLIGTDAGALVSLPATGVVIQSDLAALIDDVDVVIDFTAPEATLRNVQLCAEKGKQIVIGTTGFDASQLELIHSAAKQVAICLAANYSVGVNQMLSLLEQVSKTLDADTDIEIVETHHRHKVDAPSGTAIAMGQTIADARGWDFADSAVYGRHGITGARQQNTIGFSAIRAGDVVGDHTAIFANDGERLEITHKSSSRMSYARGAVRAAMWLPKEATGKVYDMRDVLGI